MAIYAVKDTSTNEIQLIKAKTKNGAINHVSKGRFSAKSLSTDELLVYIDSGLKVDTAEEKQEVPAIDTNGALDKVDAALKGA